MSNKLADLDKSMELAETINHMKIFLLMIDLDYARQMSEQLREHASFSDSAAVLNPLYNPLKPNIIRKQAKSLSLLVEFIETLKEIDVMKAQLQKEQSNKEDIMKLFL